MQDGALGDGEVDGFGDESGSGGVDCHFQGVGFEGHGVGGELGGGADCETHSSFRGERVGAAGLEVVDGGRVDGGRESLAGGEELEMLCCYTGVLNGADNTGEGYGSICGMLARDSRENGRRTGFVNDVQLADWGGVQEGAESQEVQVLGTDVLDGGDYLSCVPGRSERDFESGGSLGILEDGGVTDCCEGGQSQGHTAEVHLEKVIEKKCERMRSACGEDRVLKVRPQLYLYCIST